MASAAPLPEVNGRIMWCKLLGVRVENSVAADELAEDTS